MPADALIPSSDGVSWLALADAPNADLSFPAPDRIGRLEARNALARILGRVDDGLHTLDLAAPLSAHERLRLAADPDRTLLLQALGSGRFRIRRQGRVAAVLGENKTFLLVPLPKADP